jgi:hypothetical protein
LAAFTEHVYGNRWVGNVAQTVKLKNHKKNLVGIPKMKNVAFERPKYNMGEI